MFQFESSPKKEKTPQLQSLDKRSSSFLPSLGSSPAVAANPGDGYASKSPLLTSCIGSFHVHQAAEHIAICAVSKQPDSL